jgi:hypothetical protein
LQVSAWFSGLFCSSLWAIFDEAAKRQALVNDGGVQLT